MRLLGASMTPDLAIPPPYWSAPPFLDASVDRVPIDDPNPCYPRWFTGNYTTIRRTIETFDGGSPQVPFHPPRPRIVRLIGFAAEGDAEIDIPEEWHGVRVVWRCE